MARSRPVILCLALAFLLTSLSGARARTSTDSEEPQVQNQAVESALAVQRQIRDRMLAGDAQAFSELLSQDFVASDPSNTVRHREELIALVASRRLKYESLDLEVDFANQLGDDLVAVMGFETTTQSAVPVDGALADAAKRSSLRRRFTDVYRNEDGKWRLLIKQSTIVPID